MRAHKTLPLMISLVCAAGYLALLWLVHSRGYVSAADLDLWGRVLLATEGLTPVEAVATTYPPLAFISTISLAYFVPGLGLAAPKLLSVVFATALVASWFSTIRRNRVTLLAALICTAALALNPLFLRALFEGPGFVLLHWGAWLTAMGTFGLRRGHRVNDIILVSLGMAIMAFAHPYGLVLVFSSFPFLALVVPTDRLRDAPGSMLLVLFFPVLFAIFSFLYVNWVLADGPLSFWANLSRESASLGGQATVGGSNLRNIALAFFGLLAACPIGVAMYYRSRGMAPLRVAIVALLGMVFVASILAMLIQILPTLTLALSLACPIGAATAARWPPEHPHRPNLAGLLFAGLVGGLVLSLIDPSSETQRWRNALMGREVAPYNAELLAIAQELKDQDAVLFDADAAPTIIAMRGSAAGIWSSNSPQFRLAAMQQRTDAHTLVVQNRATSLGNDRVGQLLPELYEHGLSGYERIYDTKQWRIYTLRPEPIND